MFEELQRRLFHLWHSERGEIGEGEHPAGGDPPSPDPPPSDPDLPPRAAAEDGAPKPSDGPQPIPFADHDRIVKGFHTRLDKVSWAGRYQEDRVHRAMTIADLYDQGKLGTEGRAAEPDPKDEKLLGPDKVDEAGQTLYSAERAAQMAAQVAERAVAKAMARHEERLGPLEESHQRTQVMSKAHDSIEAALDSAWPLLDNGDIQNAMADAIRDAREDKRTLTLAEAYIQVAIPKLAATREAIRAEERASILAELNLTSDEARGEIPAGHKPAPRRKTFEEMSFAEGMAAEVAAQKK